MDERLDNINDMARKVRRCQLINKSRKRSHIAANPYKVKLKNDSNNFFICSYKLWIMMMVFDVI